MVRDGIPFSNQLKEKTPQIIQIRMFSWYRENKQAYRDLIFLIFFGLIVVIALDRSDVVEAFYNFSRQYEQWELDDIVLSILIVSSVCLAIFASRRWIEVNELIWQANTDSLTGLFNRRKGWEAIDIEIKRSRRYQRPLSVILFDLDHFKNVNDAHGHLVGDQVLNSVATVVLRQLRSSDILIRWGGEEFFVVCAETAHIGALHLAERLRQTIEENKIPNVGNITASFGVTVLENEDDFNTLFSRVDDHLYLAKKDGRNMVV